MQTLTPAQTILLDKIMEALDQEYPDLSAGAMLLYLNLVRLTGLQDACAPSLATLARVCKSSVRSIKLYLRKLAGLGYIRIERNGTRNVYHLPLVTPVSAVQGVAL